MAASWRHHRGERPGISAGEHRPEERGLVLVETAMILPILMLLVFGVIEFTLAFQASSKLADASRAAGRTAALLGGEDDFAEAAADAAAVALQTLPRTGTPQHLVIFEPNVHGWFGALDSAPTSALEVTTACTAGPCVSMVWNESLEKFLVEVDNWDPADHDLCGPDYGTVGIVVTGNYSTLTDMFSTILDKDATSTATPYSPNLEYASFRFDPNIAASCS